MRTRLLLAFVLVLSCVAPASCSLTTDFDGLATANPALEGGVDAPVALDGATPSDAPVASDGPMPPDGAAGRVLFADSFDDGKPLPRAWDSMAGLGSPTLGMQADAPSPPGVLSIFEMGPTAPETYLRKALSVTAGSAAVTCSLKMNAASLPQDNYGSLLWMDFGGVHYVRLDLVTQRWKLYGQFVGQPDVSVTDPQTLTGAWIELSVRVEQSGRIVVSVGNDTRTTSTAPFPFSTVRVDVGVRLVNGTANTLDLKIDDVVCTEE